MTLLTGSAARAAALRDFSATAFHTDVVRATDITAVAATTIHLAVDTRHRAALAVTRAGRRAGQIARVGGVGPLLTAAAARRHAQERAVARRATARSDLGRLAGEIHRSAHRAATLGDRRGFERDRRAHRAKVFFGQLSAGVDHLVTSLDGLFGGVAGREQEDHGE